MTTSVSNSTNLRSRVSKLYLPKTRSLISLFEIISNSIHAIHEKESKAKTGKYNGKIHINIVRNGNPKHYENLAEVDNYPIHSFEVIDNGIGLNDENIASFREFDSEKKASIGGKGVGRLVCLNVFSKLIVNSVYNENGENYLRNFEYKRDLKEGFEAYEEYKPTAKKETGTKVTLFNIEPEYQKKMPTDIIAISREIVSHFQLYYIEETMPSITVKNQNNVAVRLEHLFSNEFAKDIIPSDFDLNGSEFKIYITKSYNSKSHKVHYCAHGRSVKEEGLSKYITDLRNSFREHSTGKDFYFEIFVLSPFLNDRVNEERTNFHFSNGDDEDVADSSDDITLAKIRKFTIDKIEEKLSEFLKVTRTEKLDSYLPVIREKYPNYVSVIEHNMAKVEKIAPNMTEHELDLALYEIESEWKMDVKKEGIKLLATKKDISSLDEYKETYGKFWSEFNDIGKTDLARYVIHRRSVIDVLEKLIEWDHNERFYNEDVLHSLFFPIRENSKSISFDKQNLWLLDERLTFNSFLASDKTFSQIKEINSTSKDRVDLLIKKSEIFDKASLFSEEKELVDSYTIIEFKKPYRNDYEYGNPKKDPVRQIRKYIKEIIDGKILKNGRKIEATSSTPFYCYIIADITETLEGILHEEGFTPMPDNKGYFRFYASETIPYKAYIEVLPFKKIILNAKQRNKVLFDNLKLS